MYQPFPINVFVSVLTAILVLWAIPWKIYAVWIAVKNDHKKWFVALLLLNTLGILEIYYIFKIVNKSWAEVKVDFHHGWTLFKNTIRMKKSIE
ncbi:hypothetical protein A2641_01855 [Candidatus Nomurabacteria bacterium RIFCSPHIGHO2_01_FULL_37_25]|uniref:DUF5652 domain-containing protein n=1 Tax=Candidatus Nomurabacteria bacterium RIFCSPLOWO2_01_FULL_36_16 TaxID=1801767 RepID=A0A1F6WYR0_9BACT|nr:MAG: hypothetical protein A2641_01855 [Candidatus Nomurabacteria bacterium RIFCSPHIGHO2_01_FULL_37_25]OGI75742.1 MAG: hypothetical protein A3D36_00015 [Candidatus Nomurabacteria bacterium RIFCSPHIGHO2_02_FULL_36_29]OGI87012.1 MAG: hypothetical protein A3A91_00805 [Candidatus Nomurabacteria bacterium RIFCSPLOWO2_01_FULL_36_16]